MRRPPALFCLFACALGACAPVPVIPGAPMAAGVRAPALQPLAPVLAAADAGAVPAPDAALAARAAALRARAARLRGPVVSPDLSRRIAGAGTSR